MNGRAFPRCVARLFVLKALAYSGVVPGLSFGASARIDLHLKPFAQTLRLGSRRRAFA